MTEQRMWVRTVEGGVVAVDRIVRYEAVEGTATGRTLLQVVTGDVGLRDFLGPFASERQALDFARRHFGPFIDPTLGGPSGMARPLKVGDTFEATDQSARDLPVGTVVIDTCSGGVDAWIRSEGGWQVTAGLGERTDLHPAFTYTVVYLPGVES